MSGLPHMPKLPAGVIIQNHDDIEPILKVLLDGLDSRCPATKGDVQDVGISLWQKTNTIARLDRTARGHRLRHNGPGAKRVRL